MTRDEISKYVSYDPHTGEIRNIAGVKWRCAGERSDRVFTSKGYRCLTICRKNYLAHRVAWLLHHGKWPDIIIDHINGDRTDNRIINLREATHSQNLINSKMHASNTSGVRGVYWNKQYSKWEARLKVDGKNKWLGRFSDIREAENAYLAAAKSIFNEFVRDDISSKLVGDIP